MPGRKRKKTGLRTKYPSKQNLAVRGVGPSHTLTHGVDPPPIATVQMPGLHPGQWEVKSSNARFKVLACGRRWGKTRYVVSESIEVAAAKKGLAWWIAPSYKTAHPGWTLIEALSSQIPGARIRRSDKMIEFPGGGEIWVKTGEDPNALRGSGLDFAALDEYAYMKEAVWQEAIRPALADRKGKAIFISTPAGHNSFYRLYQLGLDPHYVEWQSWSYPTSTNPYIDPAEIEAARNTLPDRIFRQEFLAEFITDAGIVFRRIPEGVARGSDLVTSLGRAPYPRRGFSYVIGIDWGQKDDFTVLVIIEVETQNVVHLERFKELSFTFQRDRIMETLTRFGCHHGQVEENSIGLPNLEALQEEGFPLQGFSMQNKTKDELIRDLALAFERVELGIPNDPILLGELEAFSMHRTPSGLWRYGAPEGMHDDCVIALALAWRACQEGALLASFV